MKALKGSYMAEAAGEYGLVARSCPPYEVLSTRWLPYEDVIRLKGIEEMVEVYYNSRQFTETLGVLAEEWGSPFALFENLARYYVEKGLLGISHSRLARYEILYRFLGEAGLDLEKYRDLLMVDLYLRENAKSRPSFAPDPGSFKGRLREIPELRGRGKMVHGEILGDGRILLFDYERRDPLTGNAAVKEISAE